MQNFTHLYAWFSLVLGDGMKVTLSSVAVAGLLAAPAGAATLTFDGFSLDPLTTGTYSEAGMTFDVTPLSDSSFFISERLKFPDQNDPGATDQIELSTGSLFDLTSLEITHSDLNDPIVFSGFRIDELVSEVTIDADNFGLLEFTGFNDLTSVLITISGTYTDISIDNLTYEPTVVPLPASILMFGTALAALGFGSARRARKT